MGQQCHIDVRFFGPPVDLEGCFTTFYRMDMAVEGGERVTDFLQPEWANLRFFSSNAPRAEVPGVARVENALLTVTGPSSLPGKFELGTTRMWGIGLFPLGWARFIDLPASDYANHVFDGALSPVFAPFAELGERLFAGEPDDEAEFQTIIAFFRARMRDVREEARIRAVHAAIVDTEMSTVVELAERSGLSTRSLERLCRRHFGFPPKLLLRRQRFMRSLAAFMLAEGRNWSEVIDRHYHDQAHFVREFVDFMTMTPTEYAALPHPVLAAFMAERKRIWGSPAQTLDQ
ncbi:MAG: AraC family transcriptional regulator, partial [Betaproteobacteria bacterium]|nr:AraC family transcriptional regulator [Betaproteobacteria bacterium]